MRLSVGQMLDDVEPFRRFGRFGDQLQIFHVGPHGHTELVAEEQAVKLLARTLPFFGQRLEAGVLGKQQSSEFRRALEQSII